MVDQSAVGRAFTPVTARVEPGRLRFFLNTLGETNPVYRDEKAAQAPAMRRRRCRRPTCSAWR